MAGNSVQVLSVGAVIFALNGLTITHGSNSAGMGGGMVNSGTVSISNSGAAHHKELIRSPVDLLT